MVVAYIINDDGNVDIRDVQLISSILLKQYTPTADEIIRADRVPDGVITAGDLLRVQQQALGL